MVDVTGTGDKPVEFDDLLVRSPDALASYIANRYTRWVALRTTQSHRWAEIKRYLYSEESVCGQSLPWANNITVPKLLAIHDTLAAHYSAALFPPKNWLTYEGDSEADEDKAGDITEYMNHVIRRTNYKDSVEKCIQDYLIYGNAFAQGIWRTYEDGFQGPCFARVSPLDIVFDPTVSTFTDSPKILRQLVSMGEAYRLIMDAHPEGEFAKNLISWMEENRTNFANLPGETEIHYKDGEYMSDGIGTFRNYMESETVEILTFYGSYYNPEKKELSRNQIVRVVDGCYVLDQKEGKSHIHQVGWRPKQDTLYGMSPYANLLGMQYRIDHLENIRADIFDTYAFPPMKIVGDVPDFTWGPMEKIYVGDDGDIVPLWSNLQHLGDIDNQVAIKIDQMEQAVGAPKEAAGFRTPGEKTATEVKRLENAATRIFNQRIEQFERLLVEPTVNDMLGLAGKNLTPGNIRVYDKTINVANFKAMAGEDITAKGRLRATAARTYAESQIKLEELLSFSQSPLYADTAVNQHFSTKKTAKVLENLLGLSDEQLVSDFVRISEGLEAQQLAGAAQGELQKQGLQPTGTEDGSQPASPQEAGPLPEVGA